MGDILKMSQKELLRVEIFQKVLDRQLNIKDAAKFLDLSYRQSKRLAKAYKHKGAKGLISKKRGQISNHKFSDAFKSSAKQIVESLYNDFAPTFAAEKLCESHKILLSKETLRQWMIEWNLWKPKRKKKIKIHQQRERRACFGELVQIDGSPHDWFEGRSAKCCLIVFTDDATSKIVQMLFVPVENTDAYLECTRRYIKQYGKPMAFYSDRHGIFRVNIGEGGETQFARAMREIGIKLICANSPQAKGRVERVNRTLQDRLVKELRLHNISDIETANKYLEEFTKDYNARFGKAASNQTDMHIRTLPDSETLNCILSKQFTRKLSKNLEFSYSSNLYQVVVTKGKIGYGLRNACVKICEHLDGKITVWYKGRTLKYKLFEQQKRASVPIASSKKLNVMIDNLFTRAVNKPSENHPWRRSTHFGKKNIVLKSTF